MSRKIVTVAAIVLALLVLIRMAVIEYSSKSSLQNLEDNRVSPTVNRAEVDFTVQVPSDWEEEKHYSKDLVASQDYVIHTTLRPAGYRGLAINEISLFYPFTVAGPHDNLGKKFEQGLEGLYRTTSDEIEAKSVESTYFTVNGFKALSVTTVYFDKESELMTKPIEYCFNCTEKEVYIDLGNGMIQEISTIWQRSYYPDFEKTFDEVVASYRLK